LSPVLCSQSYISVPCLPFSFPIFSLCSLYPILLSRQFVALYWFPMWWIGFWVCSMCYEIVSKYAQHVMNFVRICSACDEIGSTYVQYAFRCPYKNWWNFIALSMRKKLVQHMLSVPWNCFHVSSVCDKIISACSVCACYNVQKLPQTTK
jgi:hypothetical protein